MFLEMFADVFTDAWDQMGFGRSQLEASLLESPGLLGIWAFKSSWH